MKELYELNETLRIILENTLETEKPVKKDRRSFKWYLKSKIGKNDLDWLDGEIDWDSEYRDPDDGYIWYFPLKYKHNSARVAEAVRRNLNRGELETKVILIEPDNIDEPDKLKIIFKNNKLQRETGRNNLEERQTMKNKLNFKQLNERLSKIVKINEEIDTVDLENCIHVLYDLETIAYDEGSLDVAQCIKNARIYAEGLVD